MFDLTVDQATKGAELKKACVIMMCCFFILSSDANLKLKNIEGGL